MESSSFVQDFALVVITAAVAIVIFRRLKQPPILGFLLAGVLLGPYTLYRSPVQNADTIRQVADVGLVILLFAVGVELGWERIRRVGMRVVLIGAVEISVMVGLGYQAGLLLGWTTTEAFFLGAALSVSSSAVLVKMLRDSGDLHSTRGQLIVGILVVEDFAAVVFLSVLSGIATQGDGGAGQILPIVLRLAIFAVAALVLGALIAPRVMDMLARTRSSETMLIGALGLCFGLALTAEGLGLSAGAGAFLIGMVIGDTKHAPAIKRMTAPIRDVFGALFFVSIGMLVNVAEFRLFLMPALVVSGVLITGKVLANTVATFFTGHDGRTSVQVGTGMPQPGEFSLAMVKVGAEHGAIGPAVYPVVTVSTLITSFAYPFVYGSAGRIVRTLERFSPSIVRRYVYLLSESLAMMRQLLNMKGATSARLRRTARTVLINLAIIGLLVGAGAAVLQFASEIAEPLGLPVDFLGLIVGAVVITLAIPSGLGVWRSVSRLAREVTDDALLNRTGLADTSRGIAMARLFQQSLLGAALLLLAFWAAPFLLGLLSIGELATPLPVVIVLITVALTARIAIKIHAALEQTFARTFLGEESGIPADEPPRRHAASRPDEAPGLGD